MGQWRDAAMIDTANPHACGKHVLRLDGKLVLAEFVGELSLAEFEQIRDFIQQAIVQQGPVYLLANVRRAGVIPPQVRGLLGPWIKKTSILGVSNIDANVQSRSLATLLANGMRILYGMSSPVGFHADEAAARDWVAGLERKRRASAGS